MNQELNELMNQLKEHKLDEFVPVVEQLLLNQKMHELKDGLVHSIEKSFHQAVKYKNQEKWNDAIAHLCTAVQKLKHSVIHH